MPSQSPTDPPSIDLPWGRYQPKGVAEIVRPGGNGAFGLMEISHHENEIGLFIQFDEPCPVLVVYPEGVKTFVCTFEGFEVEGGMEGIAEK